MRVNSLHLMNYRGIKDLNLIFHPQLNVLLGINGAGKSAVLDALSVLLSRLVAHMISQGKGRTPGENDIHNRMDATKIAIDCLLFQEKLNWSIIKRRQGIIRQSKYRKHQEESFLGSLKKVPDLLARQMTDNQPPNLPVIVHYPVNRAILDIPLKIHGKHTFSPSFAYENALNGKGGTFRRFFEWFRNREDLENEQRLDSPVYRDAQLEAVRIAISNMIPGFSDLRVRRSPLRMTLTKNGEELRVDQLSDGEKCFLALIGDLARRLALANSSQINPLEGFGVIMIDELDLHLHPGWQRRAISSLTETFPNCQFIITTHSAQIVSHVSPESVWIIERDANGNTVLNQPERSFGMDSNSVLEIIMDTGSRPQKVLTELAEIFKLIQDDALSDAETKITRLLQTIGQDAELEKANAMVTRKRLIGR